MVVHELMIKTIQSLIEEELEQEGNQHGCISGK